MNSTTTVALHQRPTVTSNVQSGSGQKWIERGSTTYRRISVALFLASFSTFSLLYCVQPLLPAFSTEFAIGAMQSSLALSLATGFLAVSILCAGALSERIGRRGLMFASMALAALFNLIAALAPSWHGILAARALEGFALGGVPAVALAYLAEEINPAGLGLSMGLYVGGTAFGGMIGRVGMSVMSDFFSWRIAMLSIGLVDLLAAIAFITLLPVSRNFVRRLDLGPLHHLAIWRRHLTHAKLPSLFAIGCLLMGVFVTVYNYAGFRLMAPPFSLDAIPTGLIFSAYVFGIASSSGAGALGIALTLASELPCVIAGIVVLTIGFFMAHAVASGWVGAMADNAKGHASSLYPDSPPTFGIHRAASTLTSD